MPQVTEPGVAKPGSGHQRIPAPGMGCPRLLNHSGFLNRLNPPHPTPNPRQGLTTKGQSTSQAERHWRSCCPGPALLLRSGFPASPRHTQASPSRAVAQKTLYPRAHLGSARPRAAQGLEGEGRWGRGPGAEWLRLGAAGPEHQELLRGQREGLAFLLL